MQALVVKLDGVKIKSNPKKYSLRIYFANLEIIQWIQFLWLTKDTTIMGV